MINRTIAVLATILSLAGCTLTPPKETMMETVVEVRTDKGLGTGVAVTDHLFVTAYHVIRDSTEQSVVVDGKVYEVLILKVDKDRDLALVYTKYKLTPAKTCHEPARRFDKVWAVGLGLSLPMFPTEGIVGSSMFYFSDSAGVKSNIRFIQHSSPIAPGNSGGPLFKDEGWEGYCITGINLRGYVGTSMEGFPIPVSQFNFALHLDELKEFLKGSV